MELSDENAISESRCWELLRAGWFGRVALSVDALPAIVPVEYCIDRNELAICLGERRMSERSLNNAVVGFATDSIDSASHTGWTVQVQGRARLAQPDAAATECGQHASGQIVYITPHTISGRSLQLCPFGTGLPASAQH
jgi:nitroimidazol reductase NimA-like FMN-containing flavoprotein (pyridoxamine 5'-phosphate oxidase superfamily)